MHLYAYIFIFCVFLHYKKHYNALFRCNLPDKSEKKRVTGNAGHVSRIIGCWVTNDKRNGTGQRKSNHTDCRKNPDGVGVGMAIAGEENG